MTINILVADRGVMLLMAPSLLLLGFLEVHVNELHGVPVRGMLIYARSSNRVVNHVSVEDALDPWLGKIQLQSDSNYYYNTNTNPILLRYTNPKLQYTMKY